MEVPHTEAGISFSGTSMYVSFIETTGLREFYGVTLANTDRHSVNNEVGKLETGVRHLSLRRGLCLTS